MDGLPGLLPVGQVRKLLVQEENALVLDEWKGFFFKPSYLDTCSLDNTFLKLVATWYIICAINNKLLRFTL